MVRVVVRARVVSTKETARRSEKRKMDRLEKEFEKPRILRNGNLDVPKKRKNRKRIEHAKKYT